jgi:hypothetical protein
MSWINNLKLRIKAGEIKLGKGTIVENCKMNLWTAISIES